MNCLLEGASVRLPRQAARIVLAPILAAFHERCPGVVLDIVTDDRLVDIVRAGLCLRGHGGHGSCQRCPGVRAGRLVPAALKVLIVLLRAGNDA